MLTATYSPDDNKIRIYASDRLDAETYARVRAAGYVWAPRQKIFVAPMWTPERAALAEELAGEIEDEDKSLVERAEERAERFDAYGEKRAEDAESARAAVDRIAGGIPLGQPILVGHHSEKRARKDAERIENGMRKAVRLWETSEYWTRRAKGALSAAKYKERPDVRSRRIKGLEADKRKQERIIAESARFLSYWRAADLTRERALAVANYDHIMVRYTRDKYPTSRYEGESSIWSGINEGLLDAAAAAAIAIPVHEQRIAHANRWIAHIDNRLSYERAMLGEVGGTVADRTRPEKGGAVKCWVARGQWREIVKVNRVSVTVMDNFGNGGPDFQRTVAFDQLSEVLTKAEWDAKKAELGVLAPDPAPKPRARVSVPRPDRTAFEAMKRSLKAGVQIASADQLFPTPPAIADRMVELARVEPLEHVLEPSAGTGRLLDALERAGHTGPTLAIEINTALAGKLRDRRGVTVYTDDFLSFACTGEFDVVLMNPPFSDGEDMRHILHARGFLRAGGRLVALCASGPRQHAVLKPLASEWIELGPGAFASEGTGVNVAMLLCEGGQ